MKKLAVVALVGLGLAGACVGWAYSQGSRSALQARKGRLVDVEYGAVRRDRVATRHDLVLRSSTGLAVHARLSVPRAARGPHPALVIIGGIQTGRKVVTLPALDALARQAVIVSPDYPERWTKAPKGLQLLFGGPRVRPAAFDVVASLLLLLDFLESRPDVARDRIFLQGTSFGASAVTVAAGVDSRPAAVIAFYGGGRIGDTLAHVLAPSRGWGRAWLMGRGFEWAVTPLWPERYVAAISPRPYLMVNGADDGLVPHAHVLALYAAAAEPKELIWIPGDHVEANDAALIERLVEHIRSVLVTRGLLPGDDALDAPVASVPLTRP